MRKKTLFLMGGIPGAGKSTWVQNQLKTKNGTHISRDIICSSLLNEGDSYFAYEDKVFNIFVNNIQEKIDNSNEDIFVDATHLSIEGRNRLFNRLHNLDKVKIIVVWFPVKIITALERNDLRTGRAFVPKSQIRRMYNQQEVPTFHENFKYDEIWFVDENENISIKRSNLD